MFKLTWSLSAATYGVRFQDFTSKRLSLAVGDIHIESCPPTADILKETLLNVVENQILQRFTAKMDNNLVVHVIRVNVPGLKEGSTQFEFTCGGVLCRETTLVALRIQTHLRNMGFARKALLKLVRDKDITDCDINLLSDTEESKRYKVELEHLYNSVRMQDHEMSMRTPGDTIAER